MPKFFRYTLQIWHQLSDSEGLIGYSLDANIPGRKFWTLSVWEDEEALMRFPPLSSVGLGASPQWYKLQR
jgi:hypothetical protein